MERGDRRLGHLGRGVLVGDGELAELPATADLDERGGDHRLVQRADRRRVGAVERREGGAPGGHRVVGQQRGEERLA